MPCFERWKSYTVLAESLENEFCQLLPDHTFTFEQFSSWLRDQNASCTPPLQRLFRCIDRQKGVIRAHEFRIIMAVFLFGRQSDDLIKAIRQLGFTMQCKSGENYIGLDEWKLITEPVSDKRAAQAIPSAGWCTEVQQLVKGNRVPGINPTTFWVNHQRDQRLYYDGYFQACVDKVIKEPLYLFDDPVQRQIIAQSLGLRKNVPSPRQNPVRKLLQTITAWNQSAVAQQPPEKKNIDDTSSHIKSPWPLQTECPDLPQAKNLGNEEIDSQHYLNDLPTESEVSSIVPTEGKENASQVTTTFVAAESGMSKKLRDTNKEPATPTPYKGKMMVESNEEITPQLKSPQQSEIHSRYVRTDENISANPPGRNLIQTRLAMEWKSQQCISVVGEVSPVRGEDEIQTPEKHSSNGKVGADFGLLGADASLQAKAVCTTNCEDLEMIPSEMQASSMDPQASLVDVQASYADTLSDSYIAALANRFTASTASEKTWTSPKRKHPNPFAGPASTVIFDESEGVPDEFDAGRARSITAFKPVQHHVVLRNDLPRDSRQSTATVETLPSRVSACQEHTKERSSLPEYPQQYAKSLIKKQLASDPEIDESYENIYCLVKSSQEHFRSLGIVRLKDVSLCFIVQSIDDYTKFRDVIRIILDCPEWKEGKGALILTGVLFPMSKAHASTGLAVAQLILALKVAYPDRVVIVRGTRDVNPFGHLKSSPFFEGPQLLGEKSTVIELLISSVVDCSPVGCWLNDSCFIYGGGLTDIVVGLLGWLEKTQAGTITRGMEITTDWAPVAESFVNPRLSTDEFFRQHRNSILVCDRHYHIYEKSPRETKWAFGLELKPFKVRDFELTCNS